MGEYSINMNILHWINDGLMSLFFFAVGLEIKREMLVGELGSLRKAFLPVSAAIGGMLFPALIFYFFNRGTPMERGWGIPMATDIAFALGALAVLGKRLPGGLRVFLSAFAIADDLGAVVVIALFYSKGLVLSYLSLALFFVAGLALANFFWVRRTLVYAVLGAGLWLAILSSGLHATVAGVVVALFIPARGKYDTDKFISEVSSILNEFQCAPSECGHSVLLNERHLNAVQSIELAAHRAETPLQRMENSVHPWVAFVIIPLFALSNAGVALLGVDFHSALSSSLTLGIALGLLIGKPLGISLFSYVTVKMGLASLPAKVRWTHIIGVSILGGIGFTMSLFIAILGFGGSEAVEEAKLSILTGSVLAAMIGLVFLRLSSSGEKSDE
jgi:NhaA family Na+:H+ antiporter